MSARCRCGQRIEWRQIRGRRLAYDAHDGWVHECALTRAPVELKRPGPKPTRATQTVAPPPQPANEPAVVDSVDYQRHITQHAAQLGVRERDLAYTVAYRAALQATNTNHTAA